MNPFQSLTITSFHEMERLFWMPFTQIISIHDARAEGDEGYGSVLKANFPESRTILCYFNDTESSAASGPNEAEVVRVLDFSETFTRKDRVLIHCHAGISRSTAMAFAAVCQHTPPGREKEAFALVRQLRPQLIPNRLITELADQHLHREGRMREIVQQHLEEKFATTRQAILEALGQGE